MAQSPIHYPSSSSRKRRPNEMNNLENNEPIAQSLNLLIINESSRSSIEIFNWGMPQSHISSGLQRPDEMNNLENSKVIITNKLSPDVFITGGLSLDQEKEEVLITDELSPNVFIRGVLSRDQEKEEV
uniref:Uncharacterized protein n=1 Tax=Solanum lycopersicum TaxID=4081 RepID=A0A3Q7IDB9_SOLLC